MPMTLWSMLKMYFTYEAGWRRVPVYFCVIHLTSFSLLVIRPNNLTEESEIPNKPAMDTSPATQ